MYLHHCHISKRCSSSCSCRKSWRRGNNSVSFITVAEASSNCLYIILCSTTHLRGSLLMNTVGQRITPQRYTKLTAFLNKFTASFSLHLRRHPLFSSLLALFLVRSTREDHSPSPSPVPATLTAHAAPFGSGYAFCFSFSVLSLCFTLYLYFCLSVSLLLS